MKKLVLERLTNKAEPIRGAKYTCYLEGSHSNSACFRCEFIYIGRGEFVLTEESKYGNRKEGCSDCCIMWPNSLGSYPIHRVSSAGDEITGRPMVVGDL